MKECKEKEDISLKIAIWKKEEKIKREKIESKPWGGGPGTLKEGMLFVYRVDKS